MEEKFIDAGLSSTQTPLQTARELNYHLSMYRSYRTLFSGSDSLRPNFQCARPNTYIFEKGEMFFYHEFCSRCWTVLSRHMDFLPFLRANSIYKSISSPLKISIMFSLFGSQTFERSNFRGIFRESTYSITDGCTVSCFHYVFIIFMTQGADYVEYIFHYIPENWKMLYFPIDIDYR